MAASMKGLPVAPQPRKGGHRPGLLNDTTLVTLEDGVGPHAGWPKDCSPCEDSNGQSASDQPQVLCCRTTLHVSWRRVEAVGGVSLLRYRHWRLVKPLQ